jgi:hypothetical protein
LGLWGFNGVAGFIQDMKMIDISSHNLAPVPVNGCEACIKSSLTVPSPRLLLSDLGLS